MNGGVFMIGVIIIGLLGISFQYMWPLYLIAASLTAIIYTIAKTCQALADSARQRRNTQSAIAARADQQHQQIMEGDDIHGTYGQYLPPKELRQLW